MHILYKNNVEIFRGTFDECYDEAMKTGQIADNAGLVLYTYEDIKNGNRATYQIKPV